MPDPSQPPPRRRGPTPSCRFTLGSLSFSVGVAILVPACFNPGTVAADGTDGSSGPTNQATTTAATDGQTDNGQTDNGQTDNGQTDNGQTDDGQTNDGQNDDDTTGNPDSTGPGVVDTGEDSSEDSTSGGDSTDDAGSTDTGTTGDPPLPGQSDSQLVGAGQRMSSAGYDLVITLGQPTQTLSTHASANYQLQGGLMGANGNPP